MEKQAKQFLENEAENLRKSIRNMAYTLEQREANDAVDESQIAGMREIKGNEETQLRFIEFLQERADTMQEVMDICRIYLQLTQDQHAEVERPDETEAWHLTLNNKHFLTALLDRANLEIGNFTPPETESMPSMPDDDRQTIPNTVG